MTFEYLLQQDEELKQFLGRTTVEDWYVERYCLYVDLPCMIIDVNLDIFLIVLRLLFYIWVGIEVNQGWGIIVLEVLNKMQLLFNVEWVFDKSALSMYQKLGIVDLRVDRLICMLIYSSLVSSY